jgi:hypothetical protein
MLTALRKEKVDCKIARRAYAQVSMLCIKSALDRSKPQLPGWLVKAGKTSCMESDLSSIQPLVLVLSASCPHTGRCIFLHVLPPNNHPWSKRLAASELLLQANSRAKLRGLWIVGRSAVSAAVETG